MIQDKSPKNKDHIHARITTSHPQFLVSTTELRYDSYETHRPTLDLIILALYPRIAAGSNILL